MAGRIFQNLDLLVFKSPNLITVHKIVHKTNKSLLKRDFSHLSRLLVRNSTLGFLNNGSADPCSSSNSNQHFLTKIDNFRNISLVFSKTQKSDTRQFHISSRFGRDLYNILGLKKDADQKEIKQAYFKMAKKYHPDSHPNDRNAKEKFQEISQAYDILSDESKRKEFDMKEDFAGGRAGKPGRGSFHTGDVDAEELFNRVFGRFSEFGREQQRHQHHHRDADDFGSAREISISLSFIEAARGVQKNVELFFEDVCNHCEGRRYEPDSRPIKCTHCMGSGVETISRGPFVLRQTCRHCHGTRFMHRDSCHKCKGNGKVTIKRSASISVPAGVEDGQTVRTQVDGREYFINFTVEKSKQFKRTGSDIHSDVTVSISQSVLGGVARVTGLYDDYRLNVPPGTQSHEYILLKGKGMKRVNSAGYGDHYVHVKIRTPTRMTPEQVALISTFAETEDGVEGSVNGLTDVTSAAPGSLAGGRRVVDDSMGYVAEIRRAIGLDVVDKDENVGG